MLIPYKANNRDGRAKPPNGLPLNFASQQATPSRVW